MERVKLLVGELNYIYPLTSVSYEANLIFNLKCIRLT